MKRLLWQRSQKDHPGEPLLTATQTLGVVRKDRYDQRTVVAQKDLHLLKLVNAGDFVISLRSFQGGIELAHDRGIISPAYTILVPYREQSRSYFKHLFKCRPFVSGLSLFVTGIRQGQNIDYEKLSRTLFPIPPPDEQAAIVKFIDYADRRIRRYIRAKQKLIKLLEEQKQAIIHQAVTRGLDPNVRLKPSGVEWLGDVPEHWEVFAIKRLLASMNYGTSESLAGTGPIRVLTMGHVRNGEVVPPADGSLNSVPDALMLQFQDLLFNRTNSPDLVGKVGIFRGKRADDISFASYLVRLRPRPETSAEWLNYLLNSVRFWAFARSQAFVSLHQANLSSSRYGALLVPVPPPGEQPPIAAHLREATREDDLAIAQARTSIDLLREYRTRLIADVVTGKLDVRKAAANLPDDLDTDEPELDEADDMDDTDEAPDEEAAE